MIEFLLLFALGFLTAVLAGTLVAPVLHRRIVRFAEDRLKATMPLSPQEVRAQKDAARAIYAAENVRTAQTLKRERDRAVALLLAREDAVKEARLLRAENGDLQAHLAEMNAEAGDFRSAIRLLEQHIERLKTSLDAVETDYAAKINEASLLARQLDRVSAELDGARQQSAAEAAQVDELHARVSGLRNERESLRDDIRRETERARVLDLKCAQEDARARQLDQRLALVTAALGDKERTLDRRAVEIDRLTARARETTSGLPAATQTEPAAGQPPVDADMPSDAQTPPSQAFLPASVVPDAERMRADAADFIDRLIATDPAEDAALRDRLLAIGAGMTALTAWREGDASPIPALLARESDPSPAVMTLAARTKALLASSA